MNNLLIDPAGKSADDQCVVDHRLAGQQAPEPVRYECPICHDGVVSETIPVCEKHGVNMIAVDDPT